ncbi:MAG: hypothetical protein KAS32_13555 [Candidatus Peribacteraceae bacterium]|nr:hypothetical protein [Candidatus Peribacteraceae bacterium]
MELKIINKLYLELAQVATARTPAEIKMLKQVSTMREALGRLSYLGGEVKKIANKALRDAEISVEVE